MAPDELTREKAEELLAKPSGDVSSAPTRSRVARTSRAAAVTALRERGARRGLDGEAATGSLFKTMSLETVTLEDALRLLSLPER